MGVPEFQPSHMRHLYVQVAEHIKARIDAGELAPGAKLPPERELAHEYQVAYNTIRAAMALLRDQGVIVTLHGKGTYVAEALDVMHESAPTRLNARRQLEADHSAVAVLATSVPEVV
jgi:GntR family transcriptional regulator